MTNSLLCSLTTYVLNAVWEVSLIGGTGWFVHGLLKRVGPRAQHLTWVTTLALAVLTPALPFIGLLAGVISVRSGVTVLPSAKAVGAATIPALSGGTMTLSPLILAILSTTYILVFLFFGCRLVWLLGRTVAILARSQPLLLSTEANDVWQRCVREFSVDNALIRRSSETAGPVTLGILRPVLLVPKGFVGTCGESDLLAALAHECAHMHRHDFLKNLFYEFASLPVAFHPAVWMMKSQIAQTREMICDGMATRNVIDTSTYTGSLLRLVTRLASASPVSPSSAIGIFDANILEKRIMIMKTRKPSLSLLSVLGHIVPGALLLFSAAAGGASVAKSIEAQDSDQTSVISTKESRPADLACTFYDQQGRGIDGTCGRKANTRHSFICTTNDDPTISQEQSGCEWKVQRAEQLQSRGSNPNR